MVFGEDLKVTEGYIGRGLEDVTEDLGTVLEEE
jgi:hypothetical protein